MSEFPRVTPAQWRERVERELGAASIASLDRLLPGALRVAPIYTEAPASSATVRGRAAEGAGVPASGTWERCQRRQESEAAEARRRIDEDLAGGGDGIWLRLDAVARRGLDPCDPVAERLIGQGGVAAYDVETFCALLRGPAPAGLWIDAGGNALPAAAITLAALERLQREPRSIRLRFCADPLGALASDGELPAEHATLGWEAAMLARLCDERWPGARAWLASSSPYARAGAHAALELGAVLATAVEYLRYCAAAGVSPEVAASQMVLSFDLDRNLVAELAKLRASRVLWEKVQTACGAAASPAFLHAATGERTLSVSDPWTNALRATVQTTAAALAGADSATVAPFDHGLGGSDGRGRRVARNTHTILGQESHLGEVVDPAGGSYAIETLTHELARAGWELLRRFDANGMASSLVGDPAGSTLRASVSESARRREEALREGRLPVLGVSVHPAPGEAERATVVGDRDGWKAALLERLGRRSPVGTSAVAAAVSATSATTGPATLFDALVAAAHDGATLAELGQALRGDESGTRALPLDTFHDADRCGPGP